MAGRKPSAVLIEDSARRKPLEVVFTEPFERNAKVMMSDAQSIELATHVSQFREHGDIIPETGGLRKLRWASGGEGKRGGIRVVYLYIDDEAPLYLLAVYKKNELENMSGPMKKACKKLVETLKKETKRKRTKLRLV